MFDCFSVSLSESFQRRSGQPTVLVPVVSSPNNNCFGIRSSDMRTTYHMTSPPELHLANDRLNVGHASSVKDFKEQKRKQKRLAGVKKD